MNPPDPLQSAPSLQKTKESWRPPEPRAGRGFWLLMIFSLVAVGGVAYLQFSRVDRARHRRGIVLSNASLPVLGKVPDFSLTERSGQTVTLSDLRGKVWVADFIFTSCGGPCPIMTRRMRDLQQTISKRKLGDVLTVSISVDPQRDTPKVLAEYAGMFKADPKDWLFLTGHEKEIADLTVHGFKLGLQHDPDSRQVTHSMRFVLVDRRGRIRGYYEVVTDDELQQPRSEVIDKPMPPESRRKLLADIRQLLQKEPQ